MKEENTPSKGAEKDTVYRWDYDAQRASDERRERREGRRGILVFSISMTLVFAIFLSLLCGVLILLNNEQTNVVSPVGAGSVAEISAQISPTTVLITGMSTTKVGYGTGFFLRSDGYIATNFHVIEDFPSGLTVTLYNGRTLPATVVGYHDISDLAIIKIEGTGYPVAPIGDSDALRVGELTVAVGNPGGESGSWSTSDGIVSALNRQITVDDVAEGVIVEIKMLQTTTPLNPGNSGGPLCNSKGEVIGVVTRKKIDFEGLSYCIPINGAMEILNAILREGNADSVKSSILRSRPLLGINCGTVVRGTKVTGNGYSLVAEASGVLVSSVDSSSGAAGKLLPGDIITGLDGVMVTCLEELTELLYLYRRGQSVSVSVQRGSETLTVTITLGIT